MTSIITSRITINIKPIMTIRETLADTKESKMARRSLKVVLLGSSGSGPGVGMVEDVEVEALLVTIVVVGLAVVEVTLTS